MIFIYSYSPVDLNLKDFFKDIYNKIIAKHSAIKNLVVSWIIFINSIPELKIINVIHDFLPHLFTMLADRHR